MALALRPGCNEAVAKQFDPDPLMKEISDKASEELEYDYLPSRLKNKLVRRT
jgi:hypothetical protein